MNFDEFRRAVNKAKGINPFFGKLLTFDPGETTGYSVWGATEAHQVTLLEYGQLTTWPIGEAVKSFNAIVSKHNPDAIVFEAYNIYAWKTDDHSWSSVPTVQIIGVLQTIAIQHDPPIPYVTQSAQVAKNFVSDTKLKEWGFYRRDGQRHARDSMRHGLYFLLFDNSKL